MFHTIFGSGDCSELNPIGASLSHKRTKVSGHCTNFTDGNSVISVNIKGGEPLDLMDVVLQGKYLSNAQYTKFSGMCPVKVDITQINPATPKDMQKYFGAPRILHLETYAEYKAVIAPKLNRDDLGWIDNILEKKAELKNILFENDNFILLKDMNWSGENLNTMKCLAIVKRKDLASLRDLSDKEISLLEDIRTNSLTCIWKKFGIRPEEVRAYLHYHPSFWHLHVHFDLVQNIGFGSNVERAHSLVNIINNLQIDPQYYRKVSLEVLVDSKVLIDEKTNDLKDGVFVSSVSLPEKKEEDMASKVQKATKDMRQLYINLLKNADKKNITSFEEAYELKLSFQEIQDIILHFCQTDNFSGFLSMKEIIWTEINDSEKKTIEVHKILILNATPNFLKKYIKSIPVTNLKYFIIALLLCDKYTEAEPYLQPKFTQEEDRGKDDKKYKKGASKKYKTVESQESIDNKIQLINLCIKRGYDTILEYLLNKWNFTKLPVTKVHWGIALNRLHVSGKYCNIFKLLIERFTLVGRTVIVNEINPDKDEEGSGLQKSYEIIRKRRMWMILDYGLDKLLPNLHEIEKHKKRYKKQKDLIRQALSEKTGLPKELVDLILSYIPMYESYPVDGDEESYYADHDYESDE